MLISTRKGTMKVGLMCAAVLSSLYFTQRTTMVWAEELPASLAPLTLEEEGEEADGFGAEEGEGQVFENFLDIVPPQPGDESLVGRTYPKSYVFVTIDNRQVTSTENPLVADEEGNFQLDLTASPLLYNQKIHIESYRQEAFEWEDAEGGIAETSIIMPAFDDGESQQVLTPDKDGKHRFLIQPILEGSATIKGRTSLEGLVYGFIDGTVATKPASIKEGQFELEFIEELYSRQYQLGDEIVLSFVGKDGSHHQVSQKVQRLKEEEKEEQAFTYSSLQPGQQTLTGTAPAFSQLLLYQEKGGAVSFVQEAIADEEGDYQFSSLSLQSGERYYLVLVNAQGHYTAMLRLEVGGETLSYEEKAFAAVLDYLGVEDKTNLRGNQELRLFGVLHDEKKYIFGQTGFPHQLVVIRSSDASKVFPSIPVDALGYWGINFRDIEARLKKGEVLTIQVVDRQTQEVLASHTETVRHLNDEEKWEDLPFEVGEVTSDHRYLTGKVAPHLSLVLTKKDRWSPLATTTSDASGQFGFSLAEAIAEGDILYLSAFDEDGVQVAWKSVFVGRGNGQTILPPVQPLVQTEALPLETDQQSEEKPDQSLPQKEENRDEHDTPEVHEPATSMRVLLPQTGSWSSWFVGWLGCLFFLLSRWIKINNKY